MTLSPLPLKATPTSAPDSTTNFCKFSMLVVPQFRLTFFAFGVLLIANTVAPKSSKISVPIIELTPFAQSTAILIPFKSELTVDLTKLI